MGSGHSDTRIWTGSGDICSEKWVYPRDGTMPSTRISAESTRTQMQLVLTHVVDRYILNPYKSDHRIADAQEIVEGHNFSYSTFIPIPCSGIFGHILQKNKQAQRR